MLYGYNIQNLGEPGRLLEVKGIPDSGCTSTTVPIAVAKEHGLKINKCDWDEPGMEAYGGSKVDIIGQVTFYYKPRRFKQKRLVRALVSNIPGKEILLS